MNDRAKPIDNGGGTVLSIHPLEGHSPCPIHVHLSKVLLYGLDSSESSFVGIGTPRETVLLSTISQRWRAYRGSQVFMPVNPSQMHLCLRICLLTMDTPLPRLNLLVRESEESVTGSLLKPYDV